jgi:hypothetical protein
MAPRHASNVRRGLALNAGSATGAEGRGLQRTPTLEDKALSYINREIDMIKDIAMDKEQFSTKEVHIPTESKLKSAYPR